MSDSQDMMDTAPDTGPGLGLDEPLQSAPPEGAQPYLVLASKYRTQRFSDLIGQDAMVQTLGNAIKRDRLAHAFLLTGVRGAKILGAAVPGELLEIEAAVEGRLGGMIQVNGRVSTAGRELATAKVMLSGQER